MAYQYKTTLEQITDLTKKSNKNIKYEKDKIYNYKIDLFTINPRFNFFKVLYLEYPEFVTIIDKDTTTLNKPTDTFLIRFKFNSNTNISKRFSIIATIDNDSEVEDYYINYTVNNI